jgi:hypothetical protein
MQPPDTLPPSWQRLLALSGVVFAVLFLVGWFASGGDAPDYPAADLEWTEWADDNRWKSRIGAFAMLLAGFVFLHFAGMIRSVLGTAETTVRGSAQLARVAFAGALVGIAGVPRGHSGNGRRQRVRLRLLPGVLALVIWSIATSIASYRAVATPARAFVATEADT